MKKKIYRALVVAASFALCASCSVPAFAYDSTYATGYGFSSGPDSGDTFGKSTGYDEPAKIDPLTTNERRNKDAAFTPPLYGIFSGDIPTDRSSPYHDNTADGGYMEIRGLGNASDYYGGSVSLPSYGGSSSEANGSSSLATTYSDAPGLSSSTSTSAGYNTAPKYNADGSMGTLYIERLNKTLKVFEGESLENMRKGIGHFESTSAWDGNAAFAGHNRGAAAYFSFVKDLNIGDRITYTTPYGTRTYEVYRKDKINEYDYSGLGWTVDNVISLITCVENEAELRWLVQAKEVR